MKPTWTLVCLSQFWLGLSYLSDKNEGIMLLFAGAWLACAAISLVSR